MSEWQPISTAPSGGLILVAVEDAAGERRTFAVEASHDSLNGGSLIWMMTTGWVGWNRLHSAWTPILWRPLPAPPTGDKT